MQQITNAPAQRSGFTLVELSITLVIIGLLVGGVMVGADMIHSAATRAQIKELENYQSAINTFKLRFAGLPGDLSNATSVFLPSEWPLVANGDGDEKLEDGASTYVNFTGEIAQFWMQLAASRLIEGSYNTTSEVGKGFPLTKFERNGIAALYDNSVTLANVFYVGVKNSPNPGVDDTLTPGNALLPEEAWKIDEKIDDGHPLYGNVRARGDSAAINATPDYFDVLDRAGHALPVFAGLLDWFVSPAYAGGSVAETSACVFEDDDLGTAALVADSATYALTTSEANCQLSVRFNY